MNLHYYYSQSGKNLILEYIDSLPVDEQVDGYSVLECIYSILVGNKRTKRKKEIRKLLRQGRRN